MTPTAYAYRAMRRDGAVELGVVQAVSREDASAILGGRGLFPVEITVEEAAHDSRTSLPAAELALGLRLLGDLLEAGLPMARSLAAFGEIAPPAWRPAIPEIRESVRQGSTLAAALEAASLDVPALVIGIIHAGEAGSGVGSAVRRAADLMEQVASTRSAIRSALTYPLILAFAGSASLILLVGIVLPRFAAILADLGQSLPASTRIVLAGGSLARATFIPALLAGVFGALVWRMWARSDAGRVAWHELLLRAPFIGGLRWAAASARVCGSLGALLESGVPLSSALIHSARSAGDAAIGARLLRAREAVLHGQRLSSAAEAESALTRVVVRLTRAGEETGRLASMLAHAARLESERAERTVKDAVKLIEPAMILVFGGLVALVAASLLQAVYSVRPT